MPISHRSVSILHSSPLLPLREECYMSKAHKSMFPTSFFAFAYSLDSSFFPLHGSLYYNLKSSYTIIYLHSCSLVSFRGCVESSFNSQVWFKQLWIRSNSQGHPSGHFCKLNSFCKRQITWSRGEDAECDDLPVTDLRTRISVFIFLSDVETLRRILWSSWFHSLLLETCHINLQRRYVGWRLKWVYKASIQY